MRLAGRGGRARCQRRQRRAGVPGVAHQLGVSEREVSRREVRRERHRQLGVRHGVGRPPPLQRTTGCASLGRRDRFQILDPQLDAEVEEALFGGSRGSDVLLPQCTPEGLPGSEQIAVAGAHPLDGPHRRRIGRPGSGVRRARRRGGRGCLRGSRLGRGMRRHGRHRCGGHALGQILLDERWRGHLPARHRGREGEERGEAGGSEERRGHDGRRC